MPQDVFFQETVTQGTVTILLEGGGYRGRCFYSPKIPHGLGEGDVHLSLALLDPGGYATRAEVATILRNYHRTFVK